MTRFWDPALDLPLTLAMVAVTGWWYRQSWGRSGDRATAGAPSVAPVAALVWATLVVVGAVTGPLRVLSDTYLFSAHATQFLLLSLVAAPLWLLGTSAAAVRRVQRWPHAWRALRWLTRPHICFVLFTLVLTVLHLPPVFNGVSRALPPRLAANLLVFVAGLFMWWPMLSPLPELPRASYPVQMLYCFLSVIPISIVSIYVAMADRVLYAGYAAAPRLLDITALQDQQYGGLILWIPGGVFFYAVMTVVFFKWSQRGEDDTASAQVGWVRPVSSEATGS